MDKDPLNIEALFQALSLLIVHTSVEQKEFVSRLRHTLVHTAKKECPEASIAQISQKIGMVRGTISEYLDQQYRLKIAPSNEMYILNELWKIKGQDNSVDLKGEVSFYSIAQRQLVGKYAPETALNVLISCSCVEHLRDNKLLIKSPRITIGNDEKHLMRIISDLFIKLVNTVLHNTKLADKKYQNTIATTSVPPQSVNSLHQAIFDYLKHTTMVEVRRLIEAHEDKDNNDYKEYSVSIFEHF